MKIKTKTILVIFILSFIIFGALHLTASFVIVPSYKEIERQESENSINQALSMINYRLSELEGKVREYSSWDDTYSFVLDKNQAYIDANLVTASENFDLDLIVMVDTSDRLVYCQSYDSNQSTMVSTSQETRTILRSDDLIWDFQSTDQTISGLMLLDGKPVLVATAPILTSLEQGPNRGGLLFGVYLDAQETNRFTEVMGLNFTLSTVNDFNLQNSDNTIVESLTSNPHIVLVKEDSSEVVSGYT